MDFITTNPVIMIVFALCMFLLLFASKRAFQSMYGVNSLPEAVRIRAQEVWSEQRYEDM